MSTFVPRPCGSDVADVCQPPSASRVSQTLNEPPAVPFSTPEPFLDDAVQLYKQLLRFATINVGPAGPDAGNEEACANWCKDRLEEKGIEVRVFDAAPQRRSLVACIGAWDDPEALIISAHLDVVPVDETKWTQPPFEGIQAADKNGVDCFWGRGAIDMKHMAAYGLAIMRELAHTQTPPSKTESRTSDNRVNAISEENVHLEGDRSAGGGEYKTVKLVLVADEEAGCEYGSLALVRKHPDWLIGGAVLTESGAFTTYLGGTKKAYPIQVAEKGFVWLKLKVEGTPGHGSLPTKEHAIAKLSPLLTELVEQPRGAFSCPHCVKDFMREMGHAIGGQKGWFIRAAAADGQSPEHAELIIDKLLSPGLSTLFGQLSHHTIAPTMLSAGVKANVLPSEASMVVDCRITPGTDPNDFIQEFTERFKGRCTVEVLQQGPPVENEYAGNSLFSLCCEVLQQVTVFH